MVACTAPRSGKTKGGKIWDKQIVNNRADHLQVARARFREDFCANRHSATVSTEFASAVECGLAWQTKGDMTGSDRH